MPKLSKKDVLHIADLAKLHLAKEEEDKYLKQLSKIVDYIGELSEVDTSKTEPTSQTTGLTNVYRNDVNEEDKVLSQDEALSGSEETQNGYFKVPAILTKKDGS